MLHTYPDGIKAYGHERITTPLGRRGKPVKKLRLIPAEKAFALARQFQGPFGAIVSVLSALAGRLCLPPAWFTVLTPALADCALRKLARTAHLWRGERPGFLPMSWSELARLVQEGEADAELRRALKHCRSRKELILAARRWLPDRPPRSAAGLAEVSGRN